MSKTHMTAREITKKAIQMSHYHREVRNWAGFNRCMETVRAYFGIRHSARRFKV